MCTVLIPPGDNPIALNKYIISYHITSYHIISYHIISYHIISYHITSNTLHTFHPNQFSKLPYDLNHKIFYKHNCM